MSSRRLSSGTPGKRYALPHARILMHQPSAGVGGTASDIAIQADLFNKWKQELARITAFEPRAFAAGADNPQTTLFEGVN